MVNVVLLLDKVARYLLGTSEPGEYAAPARIGRAGGETCKGSKPDSGAPRQPEIECPQGLLYLRSPPAVREPLGGVGAGATRGIKEDIPDETVSHYGGS